MKDWNSRSVLPDSKTVKKNLQAYSFMLPNLILFTVCSLYPVVWTLKYVFYQYGGYGTGVPRFVGLGNLARVFRDKVYWESVVHTFTYGFGKVFIILPLAFFLAFLLNQQKRGNGAAQSIIFLPTIMSSAVMGLVFYLLFNAYNGEVNQYLTAAGLIQRPINWLGKEHAMKTLILTAVWGGVGNYMVYFIAGIQQVSGEALESARIDGAGRLQTIWYIIIPMLGPILKIILMLAITSAFHDITNVMVLTEGGPNNATMVMSLYGYRYFFPISAAEATVPQYGYGAAVSVVSAVIAGLVTVGYLQISKKLDDIY
ncbi:carbohydrate ABC transporter permease [Lacrimispora saccharolytica]|uniref:Binding-protein-dependent transport systems inner membrane component n=1 Tax=Lacrimispora saccharolytica (strain ATCC 35040 / DSM 2544 / NRCC 2533 / WM1) TaxID=610130 RepID=D9R9B5_LACSW|nr:sugar ABC transporter permease [Lacrimispora saccharolytica]ADL05866.1 binding-protein-dependent transport systems inner membrane component [[Clostridium] saccharolyticum WM1]